MSDTHRTRLATYTLNSGLSLGKTYLNVVTDINNAILDGKSKFELEIFPIKDLYEKDARIKELEKELDQQKFNNKHNLSIDQKVADRIVELESKLEDTQKLLERWIEAYDTKSRVYDVLNRDYVALKSKLYE